MVKDLAYYDVIPIDVRPRRDSVSSGMNIGARNAFAILAAVVILALLVFAVVNSDIPRKHESERFIDYSKCVSYSVGRACLGMNKAEAARALGTPEKINRTTTPSGIREQWIYGDKYLYFDGGLLVSFQD